MSFAVPAEKYDRFMGRYVPPLAVALADMAGIGPGSRVVDVGCGPGGLTSELARRAGADAVAAVDPSPPFVLACRDRNPGADVREGVAEELPWGDGEFDAALSCLVVSFMRDADAGAREMARVTKPGGTVAACMWSDEGMTMLRTFWTAARAVDPAAGGEQNMFGRAEGDLGGLLGRAGLDDVEEGLLQSGAQYRSFEDWWEPFTYGVGPAGGYLCSLDDERREAVREACRAELGDPQGSFALDAVARFARGRVP